MHAIYDVLVQFFRRLWTRIKQSHMWLSSSRQGARPRLPPPRRNGAAKREQPVKFACKDYLWAWSDTCYIDKDSSAGLQAIVSMFTWYPTIRPGCRVPRRRSRCRLICQWQMVRTWVDPPRVAGPPHRTTLHPQPRPPTALNHKKDSAVLEELECTTETDFSSAMNAARFGLQWASSRRTTRPEEIANSPFGIFDLYLPVLHGESCSKPPGSPSIRNHIAVWGDLRFGLGRKGINFSQLSPDLLHLVPCIAFVTSPKPEAERRALAMARGSASTEVLRKLHSSLAESAHPRFIGRHIILPCFDQCYNVECPNTEKPVNAAELMMLYNIAQARAISRTLRTPMSRNPDTFEMI